MFSSTRKRYPLISDGVRIDALGTIDRPAEVVYGILTFPFDLTHLPWVVVIVRQRVIHVSYVKVVPIGNSLWSLAPLFDEGIHLADADSAVAYVRLAQEIAFDPPGVSLRHTYMLLLLPQKHTELGRGEAIIIHSYGGDLNSNTMNLSHSLACGIPALERVRR